MQMRMIALLAAGLVCSGLSGGCSDHGITQVDDPRASRELSVPDSIGAGELVLFDPVDGALIAQNDSTIACPYHEYRGYGFQIVFDWADADSSLGPVTYFIHAKKETAQYPILQNVVLESQLTYLSCNGFVIDRNLDGWWWYVAALDTLGNILATSDTNHFAFLPCRHGDGSACTAPAAGVAPALSPTGVE